LRHTASLVLTVAVCAVVAGPARSLRWPSGSLTCPVEGQHVLVIVVDEGLVDVEDRSIGHEIC
jgi:hypothetical protein